MNRRHVVLGALPMAVLSVLNAPAAQADLPLVAGNFQIAQDFLHGDAHVVVVGDSEQNSLIGAYLTTWKVDKWSGIVEGPNMNGTSSTNVGGYTFGFTGPYIASQAIELPDSTDPLAQAAPGAVNVITFNSQAAPANPDVLSNRVYEVNLEPDQASLFNGGAWDNTGTMHTDAIVYANPTGVSSGVEYLIRGAVTNTLYNGPVPVNTNSSTAGLIDIPLSVSSSTIDSTGLSGSFRMVDGVAPAQNSNLVVAGVRYSNGLPGFQLADIAQGGKDIDYFLNAANDDLDQYVQMTDSNIAYIWLGQNNPGNYTGPQFKIKLEQLMGKFKAANPNMKFVLVSTYDTGSAVQADDAEAEYEIAQSDSSVLFLNMYEAAGSFSNLDANYLADHVHPNAAGVPYFANLTQTLLADADSMAVKLPGDANLDGVVDSSDFAALAAHYGQTGAYLALGDFNGDGTVNALDFNALASNYGKTLSSFEAQPAGSIVPEPGVSMILLSLLLAAPFHRRVRFLANKSL